MMIISVTHMTLKLASTALECVQQTSVVENMNRAFLNCEEASDKKTAFDKKQWKDQYETPPKTEMEKMAG